MGGGAAAAGRHVMRKRLQVRPAGRGAWPAGARPARASRTRAGMAVPAAHISIVLPPAHLCAAAGRGHEGAVDPLDPAAAQHQRHVGSDAHEWVHSLQWFGWRGGGHERHNGRGAACAPRAAPRKQRPAAPAFEPRPPAVDCRPGSGRAGGNHRASPWPRPRCRPRWPGTRRGRRSPPSPTAPRRSRRGRRSSTRSLGAGRGSGGGAREASGQGSGAAERQPSSNQGRASTPYALHAALPWAPAHCSQTSFPATPPARPAMPLAAAPRPPPPAPARAPAHP